MPMFARKYSVGCGYCHTTIPLLNETGFKFRAAGLSLVESLGKHEAEKKFELGDNFSARIPSRSASATAAASSARADSTVRNVK